MSDDPPAASPPLSFFSHKPLLHAGRSPTAAVFLAVGRASAGPDHALQHSGTFYILHSSLFLRVLPFSSLSLSAFWDRSGTLRPPTRAPIVVSKPHPRSIPSFTSRNPTRLISIAIASAVALLFYWLSILRSSSSSSAKFGFIIDGGSTGTRIYVLVYEVGKGSIPEIDFKRTVAMKVTPALSAYSEDPEVARESVVELVEFGRKRVPKGQWGQTEVRLMDTVGVAVA